MPQIMLDSRNSRHIYIVTEDVTDIAPTTDGVRLLVRWNDEYRRDERFKVAKLNRSLAITLEGWQIKQAADILRKDAPFCSPCYDWGKSPIPKSDCLRCTLLDTCRRSGAGDYRKVIGPASEPVTGSGRGMLVAALWVMFLLWWVAVCQWSATCQQIQDLSVKLHSTTKEKR